MNSFNAFTYNENVKRQIFLKRQKNSLSELLTSELKKHDLLFSERLHSSFMNLSDRDILKLTQSTVYDTDRLKAFKSTLIALQKSSNTFINSFIDRNLDELVVEQFRFQSELLKAAKKESNIELELNLKALQSDLKIARRIEPMFNTNQSEYTLKWSRGRSEKVLAKIRIELRRGKSRQDVLKSLYGTPRRFKGVLKDTSHGARLALKTLHTSAITSVSRFIVSLNEDFDLINSSMLDSGSASQCLKNNNKFVYKNLNGSASPYHFNCNTHGFVWLMPDTPPKASSVLTWWKGSSEKTKKDLLGEKRYRIYKDSGNEFSEPIEFISNDGDFYTLKDLKQKGVFKD